jgi:hypothetical protein
MLIFFGVSYLLASLEEWLFHKYMHLNMNHPIQKTHLLHHAHTGANFDVSLAFSDDICFDVRNPNDFAQLSIFLVGNSSFLCFLFPSVNWVIVTTTTAGLLTFNIFVWNTYHAYIHGLDSWTLCFLRGIPREYVPVRAEWVIQNHQTHHRHPRGNFNIVFPGADYVLGTYYLP